MKQLKKRQIIFIIITICFIVLLYFVNRIERVSLYESEGRSFEKATVLQVTEDNIQDSGQYLGQQTVILQLNSGEYKGTTVEAYSSSSYLYGAHCVPNMKVIASVNDNEGELYVNVYSFDRSYILYAIVLLFLITIWALGGKQGLNSVLSLIFTFVCIILLFIPLIYKGMSPIIAAMIVSALTTVVTMYLIGGVSSKTFSAILSTIIGVVLSGVLAVIFGYFTKINGFNVSDIEQLEYVGQMTNVKIGELLYAGILISSLGAIMDVAMSVGSPIHEIHSKIPEADFHELFKSGINVGRDMMGTMSNTLILAFTGSSINTLIFIYAYGYGLNQLINMYSIGIEIIQGAAATLGVILTVPISAYINSMMICKIKRKGEEISEISPQ